MRESIAEYFTARWHCGCKICESAAFEHADAILALIDGETGFVVEERCTECQKVVKHIQSSTIDTYIGKPPKWYHAGLQCPLCNAGFIEEFLNGTITRDLTFEEMKALFDANGLPTLNGKTITRKEVVKPMK